MTVDRESLKALRAAAEAATPGEWTAKRSDSYRITGEMWVETDAHPSSFFRGPDGSHPLMVASWVSDEDATYIALANPAAILELIDAYEAADVLAKEVTRHLTDEVWHFAEIEAALVNYEEARAALSGAHESPAE